MSERPLLLDSGTEYRKGNDFELERKWHLDLVREAPCKIAVGSIRCGPHYLENP